MKRLISRFFECSNSLLARISQAISPMILALALTTFIVAHSTHVYAANVYSSLGTGNWSNPAIWSGGVVPTSSDDVFIGGGHVVTVDSGYFVCLDLHIGDGTPVPNGGILIITDPDAVLDVHGDVTVGIPSFGAGAISMAAGRLYLQGALIVDNGGLIATGGKVIYSGNTSQVIAPLTYHNLHVFNAGLKTAGGPITVKGSLTVYDDLDLGSFTHHLRGDLECRGNISEGASTLYLDGTSNQQVKAYSPITLNSLVVSGPSVEIVDYANDQIVLTGDLTINAGATFNVLGIRPVTVDGDWTNSGTFDAGPGTVILAGNSVQKITNNIGSFNNLILEGTGTKQAYSDLFVDGAFRVDAGATYHVQPAYDTHLKGVVDVNGTLDLGNTTLWLDGTGPQDIPGDQTFGTLRLAGSTKTATGALTVNGNLIVAADAIFNPISYNHDLKGNLNNDGTVHAGTGLISFDGTGPQFIRGSGSTTFNSVWFFNSLKTAEASFTVNDLFYIHGSASFDAGSNTITVKGDWNGGGTFIPGTSAIILNSPSPQSIIGSPTFKNLTLSGAGTKTANSSITVDSTFIINAAATFDAGSGIHHVKGDWNKSGDFLANNGAIVFDGSRPQLITGAFRFNNVTMDNDSGVRLVSTLGDSIQGVLTFNAGRLVLGPTNLTLGPSATVTGAAEGKCIITSGAGRVRRTIQGGSSAQIFIFPIAPNKTSYNPLTIGLRPDPSEPTETFTVRVEEFTNASIGFSVTDTAFCTWRIWTIEEETIGGNRTNLAFQWDPDEDGSNIGIIPADPVMAMAYVYVNGTGRYEAVDDAVGPQHLNNPIVATTLGYTTLSFGSYVVGNAIALSTQVVSFTGVEIPQVGVRLDWRTLSEVNNLGFYVQRKRQTDSTWIELPTSFTPGYGTTNEPHDYSFVDSAVAGGEWQYRLRQEGLDGRSHYSDSISVSVLTDVKEPQLPAEFALRQNYPNPFNPSTVLRFALPTELPVRLEIFNIIGQRIRSLINTESPFSAGWHEVQWDGLGDAFNPVPSGVYFYRLQAGTFVETKRMILVK